MSIFRPILKNFFFSPSADNLSYIEHIFEISRRPDLLTRVIEYRTTVLKISEDDEIDTKLTRIPSAKKYKGTNLFLSFFFFLLYYLLKVWLSYNYNAATKNAQCGRMSSVVHWVLIRTVTTCHLGVWWYITVSEKFQGFERV